MTVTIYFTPARAGNLKKRFDELRERLRSSTFKNLDSEASECWLHAKYQGKVYFHSDGHLCKITGKDDLSEAFTLGSFLNWIYRHAKEEVKAIAVIFPSSVADV